MVWWEYGGWGEVAGSGCERGELVPVVVVKGMGGSGWVEFWVCLFCQGFKLKNTRNFASVTPRVCRVPVFSSKFASSPIASQNWKMPSRWMCEDAKTFRVCSVLMRRPFEFPFHLSGNNKTDTKPINKCRFIKEGSLDNNTSPLINNPDRIVFPCRALHILPLFA